MSSLKIQTIDPNRLSFEQDKTVDGFLNRTQLVEEVAGEQNTENKNQQKTQIKGGPV